MLIQEFIGPDNWSAHWTVRKWRAEDWEAGREPYEVREAPRNLLVNGGIQLLEDLLIGAGGNPYNAANSFLKVGNGTTAAAATDTDLLGGSTAQKVMDPTFPSRSAQTITWRSTFGTAEANFTWNEFALKNGSGAVSGTVKILNRKVQLFGTKLNTEVWELTLTVTIA